MTNTPNHTTTLTEEQVAERHANQDILKQAEMGGFFYVIGSVGVALTLDNMLAQWPALLTFACLFLLLALVRWSLCNKASIAAIERQSELLPYLHSVFLVTATWWAA